MAHKVLFDYKDEDFFVVRTDEGWLMEQSDGKLVCNCGNPFNAKRFSNEFEALRFVKHTELPNGVEAAGIDRVDVYVKVIEKFRKSELCD